MSRIGLSIATVEYGILKARSRAESQIAKATLRIATGEQMQSPADGPADYMRLSQLQSEQALLTSTMNNISRATTVAGGAADTLDLIRAQVVLIQTELEKEFDTENPMSADDRTASQAAIDDAITAINNLSRTEFEGIRPLDGSGTYFSSYDTTEVAGVEVYRKAGTTTQTVEGAVTKAAQAGSITYTGDASDLITDDATFTLTGSDGSKTFSVTAGETLDSLADQINDSSYQTRLVASVDAASHTLTVSTVDYGSAATASIDVASGTFTTDATSAQGVDAEATLNGQNYTAAGNVFSIHNEMLDVRIEIASDFSGTLEDISIGGSAPSFDVWGEPSLPVALSLPGVQAVRLGGVSGNLQELASGGSLSGLDSNAAAALRVVEESLSDLDRIEGITSGYVDGTLAAASSVAAARSDNIDDSIEAINGVNYEQQQAVIDLYSDLADNATAGLIIMSQQRSAIVTLIQQMAGLT